MEIQILMMKTIKFIIFFIAFFCFNKVEAQYQTGDTVKLDKAKILSYALDADVKTALIFFNTDTTKLISESDTKLKIGFESRFKYSEDKSTYLEERDKFGINDLLKVYVDYWRIALLNSSSNFDSLLGNNLLGFLKNKFSLPDLYVTDSLKGDTLDYFIKKYVKESGLLTTGFGKTGKLLDLLVWKNQMDSVYKFNLPDEEINVKVVFMTDFATLGWEEYATLGTAYPGGWATEDALYCVKDAYDLNSENFLVSYLAHEGRHFSDYKLYNNKLSGAELEYRAKLTELCLAKKSIHKLISFFINNANYESYNSHSIANYCVIRDLSKKLFNTDFEKDNKKWEQLDLDKINNASISILKENTEQLKKQGKGFKHFIQKEFK